MGAWNESQLVVRIKNHALWFSVILCGLVFWFDLLTPLGLAAGIAYVPIIFFSVWCKRSDAPYLFAIATTILTIAGYFLSPPGTQATWIVLTNRSLSIGAIWFVAMLIYIIRQDNDARKQSEERYDLMVQGMSVGLWDWNVATNELHWSAQFKQIVGVDDEHFVPHYNEFADRLHPEDKEATIAALFSHVEHHTPYNVEYRLQREDKYYVWIHATGQCKWDEKRNPLRMVGSVNDISERKQAEQQIKDEAARVIAITNTVLDGLITIDGRGSIQTFNPAASRIFGYEPEEVIGKNVSILMPEPYHSEHDGYLHNYQTTGEKKIIGTGREVQGRRKDGSVFAMELGVNEMATKGARMFVGTVRDISERKQAETYRRKLMDQLMQSNTELERFAYVASHDMQEPLRMITNFSEIIVTDYQDKLDDTGKEYLRIVKDAGDRMRDMVDDLLEYARVGNESIVLVPVDGAKELSHVLTNLQGLIHDRHAVVTYDVLPMFMGNAVQFMRLLQNLITNAIKYQPMGRIPKIHVGVEDQGDCWCVSVKDNGVGIAAEFVQQVFQPFRRLQGWNEEKGTGIGLAVCRKIVDNHKGTIGVVSTPGEGSVFHFTLHKISSQLPEAA